MREGGACGEGWEKVLGASGLGEGQAVGGVGMGGVQVLRESSRNVALAEVLTVGIIVQAERLARMRHTYQYGTVLVLVVVVVGVDALAVPTSHMHQCCTGFKASFSQMLMQSVETRERFKRDSSLFTFLVWGATNFAEDPIPLPWAQHSLAHEFLHSLLTLCCYDP